MKCPHCNALVVVNEKGELVEYIAPKKEQARWDEIGWGCTMILILSSVLCVGAAILSRCG